MRLQTALARVVPTLLAAATLCAEPASSFQKTINVFDARYLRKLDLHDPARAAEVCDTMHTLAAVQWLANREAPRLYVIYCA